ncbi:MAG: hypothetical protein ACLP8B_20780 [Xanthobacteraceae bacterium]
MLVSGRLMSRHQMTHHRGGGSPGSKIAAPKPETGWAISKIRLEING